MVVIPAIDILQGRCVRLTQGDYGNPTIYSDDPAAVAADLAESGAKRVHVVDLDAARGSGSNRDLIKGLLKREDLQVQVGGGIRTNDAVDAWLDAGASAVVLGTVAVRDPRLLERSAHRYPGRLIAALDIRDNRAAVSGWTQTEPVMIGALVGRWDPLPLAGVILTCIDRDGTMTGPDLESLKRLRAMTGLTLQYSGGVSSLDDIANVAAAGAQAVILGKALYEGKVSLAQALAL